MHLLHRKLRRLPVAAVPALVTGLALLGSVALPSSTASAYDLRVRSWGQNTGGQLGDGTTVTRQTPVSVVGMAGAELATPGVDGGAGVIAAGGTGAGATASGFALTRLANGTVEAWGKNDKGQLGNGTVVDSSVPGLVAGLSEVQAIAAGGSHALALLKDGTVKAWGNNDKGQLGDGKPNATEKLPVTVAGLDHVKAIAAGDSFSMALLQDGTVKTWGNNDKGQLGVTAKPAVSTAAVPAPTPATRTTALAVPELSTVKGIAAGASHALALLADDTVMAWGLNANGQLGDDSTVDKPYPVAVLELKNVTALSAGASHTIALLTDKTLRGWGLNTNGQVGDGTLTQRTTSVPLVGLAGVVAIASGATHNLAVLEGGTVQAWGNNATGQLGNGTLVQSPTPVEVLAKSGNVSIVAAPSNGNFSLAR